MATRQCCNKVGYERKDMKQSRSLLSDRPITHPTRHDVHYSPSEKKIGLLKMIKQPTYINYHIRIQTN